MGPRTVHCRAGRAGQLAVSANARGLIWVAQGLLGCPGCEAWRKRVRESRICLKVGLVSRKDAVYAGNIWPLRTKSVAGQVPVCG